MMTIMKTAVKNLAAGFSSGMKSLSKVLYENIKLLMTGMILILMIIASAILISLYFGGDVVRELVISEISGSAYITRGNKKLAAGKSAKLMNGDILSTDRNSTVRISLDDNKYIFVEPESSLYIYFTEIASEGDISVNLSRGAVICEINEKLKKKSSFTLKTPNSIVSVKGTVFRVKFDYMASYVGYNDEKLNNVMITQVQNFDGSVDLQLYDSNKDPFDLPKLLTERTSAQMITADEVCQYGYLNYDTDLGALPENTLHEILRSSNERELGFTHDEINSAYKKVVEENRRIDTVTDVTPQTTQEISITTAISTTTEAAAESSVTATAPPETEEESSGGTLRSTLRTYEYTTYSGVKWWEITGNSNTGTDDYDDWFNLDEAQSGAYSESDTTTVTAVTAAPDVEMIDEIDDENNEE